MCSINGGALIGTSNQRAEGKAWSDKHPAKGYSYILRGSWL